MKTAEDNCTELEVVIGAVFDNDALTDGMVVRPADRKSRASVTAAHAMMVERALMLFNPETFIQDPRQIKADADIAVVLSVHALRSIDYNKTFDAFFGASLRLTVQQADVTKSSMFTDDRRLFCVVLQSQAAQGKHDALGTAKLIVPCVVQTMKGSAQHVAKTACGVEVQTRAVRDGGMKWEQVMKMLRANAQHMKVTTLLEQRFPRNNLLRILDWATAKSSGMQMVKILCKPNSDRMFVVAELPGGGFCLLSVACEMDEDDEDDEEEGDMEDLDGVDDAADM